MSQRSPHGIGIVDDGCLVWWTRTECLALHCPGCRPERAIMVRDHDYPNGTPVFWSGFPEFGDVAWREIAVH